MISFILLDINQVEVKTVDNRGLNLTEKIRDGDTFRHTYQNIDSIQSNETVRSTTELLINN